MAERNFNTEWRWWDDLEKKTKLEQAFAIGCTDREACIYAEITLDQLYYYTREINPAFQALKEELKERPILKARQTVVSKLSENYSNAMDYLKRKRKLEFAERTELTGKDGESLTIQISEAIAKKNGLTETTDGATKESL